MAEQLVAPRSEGMSAPSHRGLHFSGSATISAGDTYVTVTHGLGFTPDLNLLDIKSKSNLKGRSYYASNATSTTFRINISSSDLDDHTFGWDYPV